jgi:hypothetical protein
MDLAAASGARATRMSLLRAGWRSWRTRTGATCQTASGLIDCATFRERAEASVRCTGLQDSSSRMQAL